MGKNSLEVFLSQSLYYIDLINVKYALFHWETMGCLVAKLDIYRYTS